MASIVPDMLDQYSQDNVYSFHILYIDLAANSKAAELMNTLGWYQRFASSRKYDGHTVGIAEHVKTCKQNGNVWGLLPEDFIALDIDNLEQYHRHARNPVEAHISILLTAAQQHSPSKCKMKIETLANNDKLTESITSSNTCMNDVNEIQSQKIQIFSFFPKKLILYFPEKFLIFVQKINLLKNQNNDNDNNQNNNTKETSFMIRKNIHKCLKCKIDKNK